MQLKCRASATQRQPPINKRDYRRTNKCAGGSFHGRPASQRCQPPLFLSLSLSPFPRSFSFFLGRLTGSLALSRGCEREFGSATSATSTTTTTFSSSSTFLSAHTVVRALLFFLVLSRVHTHTYTYEETDILPSARGAHNKKVETSRLCGHVPHPSRVCW